MKILLLSFFLSFHSFAGINVISDLDDTIKITDAGNLGRATVNGIFSDKVFTGMPEFLKETRTFADALFVVSAGPKLIKSRVISLMKKHEIQHDGIFLRKIPGKEGKLEYKLRTIVDLMEKNPGDVILLGDDVDLDPEIYAEVQKKFPERILGIYIRAVENREIPAGFTKYWTSLDLALKEHLAGRLSETSVLAVIEPLLKETKLKRIFPKFAHCPTSAVMWEWQLSTLFSAEAQELSGKLNQYCMKGKSTSAK